MDIRPFGSNTVVAVAQALQVEEGAHQNRNVVEELHAETHPWRANTQRIVAGIL